MKSLRGFSIVEALIASAIFGLLTIGLVSGYLFGLESTALAGNRARATLLAEEGIEAVRNIRDGDFENLVDGAHGLTQTESQWDFLGTSNEIDIFSRVVDIGTIDADRKFVTSTVTWQQNPIRTGTVQIVARITNWLATAGVGSGNWTFPSLETTYNLSGNSNGKKLMGQGNYLYMVRSGGNPDFIIFDITNPAIPTVTASLSLSGTPTNIYVSGDYAYVTNESDSEELQIIDVSSPTSPGVVGTYNDTGVDDALGVFVSGDYAYLTFDSGDNIVSVNVATSTSPTFAHGLDLSGGASEVFVSGNYAYLSSTSDTEELQVINITTPTSMSQAGYLDLSSEDDASTVSGYGALVVVGRIGGQLEIIDVSTPTSPVFSGAYVAADAINDVSISFISLGDYAVIATDDILGEFQVIDISTPSTPVILGKVNEPGDLNGVWYNAAQDRVYAACEHNVSELTIYKPL